MMQANDPLSALRDIHLPEPVPFWPLAIGWWVLFGLLALAIAGAWFYRRQRLRSLKLAALRELATLREHFESSGDVQALALELSDLLRRVALARFPRHEVASLHGEPWARFVSSTARSPELTARMIAELELALYATPEAVPHEEAERWIGATRSWIGGVA